jgi:hypothetical protein
MVLAGGQWPASRRNLAAKDSAARCPQWGAGETLAHRYWQCLALAFLEAPAICGAAHHATAALSATAAGRDTALLLRAVLPSNWGAAADYELLVAAS